jgi:ABC-type nitrate/sulfonate/bicarbonate transport system ATPase subunit
MDTRLEAPVAEPQSSERTGVVFEGVRRTYPGGVQALAGVDLEVADGEVVAVVGRSGCGKSTLLELAAGLQEPDAGSVSVGGRIAATDRLAACAHMPQRDQLMPWRDAVGNAALALECRGASRTEARRAAAPLLRRFGLAGFERSRPAALSGGMRQRVAFLRTLLAGRPVLLLDEPFAALDSITRASMQEWLAGALAAEPRTVLLATHDVEEALFLSDRVAVMSPRPGRVVLELAVDEPRPRQRRETVADPRFVECKRRALEAIEA